MKAEDIWTPLLFLNGVPQLQFHEITELTAVTVESVKVDWAANKSFEVLILNSNSRELELSNFFRARSPLYRSHILQVNTRWNTRWKALAEIYTMHSFAPFWIP